MIGLLRFFLAERLRQRAERARAYQRDFMPGSYGHEVGAWLASANDMLAEAFDHREEWRAILRLSTLFPITIETARRCYREHGEEAENVIEDALRSGRTP